jgi:hypothetical protein
MDKIVQFLQALVDPNSVGGDGIPPFHFYLPWIIFCALAILVPLYYALEGRKRFVGHHTLNKWALDKFFNQLWPIGLVGFILMGARYGEMFLLGLRIWRYAWALWVLIVFGYWAYYFAFRYREHLAAFRAHRTKQSYMPQPKSKRRPARPAGTR